MFDLAAFEIDPNGRLVATRLFGRNSAKPIEDFCVDIVSLDAGATHVMTALFCADISEPFPEEFLHPQTPVVAEATSTTTSHFLIGFICLMMITNVTRLY